MAAIIIALIEFKCKYTTVHVLRFQHGKINWCASEMSHCACNKHRWAAQIQCHAIHAAIWLTTCLASIISTLSPAQSRWQNQNDLQWWYVYAVWYQSNLCVNDWKPSEHPIHLTQIGIYYAFDAQRFSDVQMYMWACAVCVFGTKARHHL